MNDIDNRFIELNKKLVQCISNFIRDTSIVKLKKIDWFSVKR